MNKYCLSLCNYCLALDRTLLMSCFKTKGVSQYWGTIQFAKKGSLIVELPHAIYLCVYVGWPLTHSWKAFGNSGFNIKWQFSLVWHFVTFCDTLCKCLSSLPNHNEYCFLRFNLLWLWHLVKSFLKKIWHFGLQFLHRVFSFKTPFFLTE